MMVDGIANAGRCEFYKLSPFLLFVCRGFKLLNLASRAQVDGTGVSRHLELDDNEVKPHASGIVLIVSKHAGHDDWQG
jgi:hypothetical protein